MGIGHFDAGACDAYCEHKLYVMRQVRRAQGKDMDRIERLWVLTDAASRARMLLAASEERGSPAMELRFSGQRRRAHLPRRPARQPDDALPARSGPSRMLKDLQRLMKYSRFG